MTHASKKKSLWSLGRRSLGRHLVFPFNHASGRVHAVQGFIEENKTLGLWLLSKEGTVLAEFNPSDLKEPQGTRYELTAEEVVIGVYFSKKESPSVTNLSSLQKDQSIVAGFGLTVLACESHDEE